jgi:hypothetical protein
MPVLPTAPVPTAVSVDPTVGRGEGSRHADTTLENPQQSAGWAEIRPAPGSCAGSIRLSCGLTAEVCLTLVALQVRVRYKQTLLGAGWVVIQPRVAGEVEAERALVADPVSEAPCCALVREDGGLDPLPSPGTASLIACRRGTPGRSRPGGRRAGGRRGRAVGRRRDRRNASRPRSCFNVL